MSKKTPGALNTKGVFFLLVLRDERLDDFRRAFSATLF